jgi:hypothetical protein
LLIEESSTTISIIFSEPTLFAEKNDKKKLLTFGSKYITEITYATSTINKYIKKETV